MKNLIFGVGINDADYDVRLFGDGSVKFCPIYVAWVGMLKRCYSDKFKNKSKSYNGCTVCDEWLLFSNFKLWASTRYFYGAHLDKDLISVGNKIYTPELCSFVTPMTNTFIIKDKSRRADMPTGVSWHKQKSRLRADCRNPFTGKKEFLGNFTNPDDAYEAWRKRKHELACQIAGLQADYRVAEALRSRYLI